MLKASTVSSLDELYQILKLQQQNLKQRIDQAEMQSQGFVTLSHTIEVLGQMHHLAPSVIIKDEEQLVAYALVMLKECRSLIAPLEPMFANLDQLQWQGKPLNDSGFYVMGQICVDKAWRGKGLFEMLYHKHRAVYQHRFDFVVTEISIQNQRSLKAHQRTGFEIIGRHKDELDEWAVVLWDWK